MKIINIFIKNIKTFRANILPNLLVLIIFPLILGLFYGMLYDKMINPQYDYFIVNNIDSVRELSSKSIMLTSAYTALSLFIAINFSSYFLRERGNHVVRRLDAVNLSKETIYLGEVLSSFLISLFMISLYYFIAYYLILKIEINLINLFIAIILNSIFICSFNGLIIGIFRTERGVKTIIMPIVFLMMFLGGSFFPVDSIKNAAKFAKLTPNYNMQKIYSNILAGNTFDSFSHIAFKMLVISLIFMVIGYFSFSLKERY